MLHNKHPLHTLILTLTLAALPALPVRAGEAVSLTHVHGLSYSADGKQLLIPSHHGLAVYESGRWAKAAGPQHDYMGFSATRDTLYSSGHPAPGSAEVNPFGLIKSRDGGKSWQKLGLERESDFHVLATSYATGAVYVFNHERNSRMDQAGIYYTRNDGLKWQRAAARGLGPKVNSLAVHPTDASLVAAGLDDGLYLSRDAGDKFEQLVGGTKVLAQTFDLDGEHLWFSTYATRAALSKIALKAGARAVEITLPALAEDAVAYIAQNPVRHSEIAIATYKRNVYLRKDESGVWTQLAKEGSSHE